MNTQEMINAEIAAVKKICATPGMVAVVCESKLTAKSKKSWFGFHYEKVGAVAVGNTYTNNDKSVYTVLAII